MNDVTFGRNSLALEIGDTIDCHCEFLQIFGQLITKSDPYHWTVTVIYVYLNVTICVKVPFISQAYHLDVMQESGILTSFVFGIDLLDFIEDHSTILF